MQPGYCTPGSTEAVRRREAEYLGESGSVRRGGEAGSPGGCGEYTAGEVGVSPVRQGYHPAAAVILIGARSVSRYTPLRS